MLLLVGAGCSSGGLCDYQRVDLSGSERKVLVIRGEERGTARDWVRVIFVVSALWDACGRKPC